MHMTTKQRALHLIAGLPEDASLGEILKRLRHLEQESEGQDDQALEDRSNAGAWDLLRNLTGSVEMPSDWAGEHDHYLYGTPKRSAGS
jgi:hypothetical protein